MKTGFLVKCGVCAIAFVGSYCAFSTSASATTCYKQCDCDPRPCMSTPISGYTYTKCEVNNNAQQAGSSTSGTKGIMSTNCGVTKGGSESSACTVIIGGCGGKDTQSACV
jgi:hypothetical protein